VHTDPRGTRDAALPANVRVYAFGGTQHGPAVPAAPQTNGVNRDNPADFRPVLRALLDALDAWAKDGTAPPPSAYPRIDDGTLVDWRAYGFPGIPQTLPPTVIQQPTAAPTLGKSNAMPGWRPVVMLPSEGPRYGVRVPKSDTDGNDLGALRLPDLAVPLATHTGWNLRRREVGAEGELTFLTGSYIPFARTAAERKANGDPRPSLQERYGDFAGYRRRFAAACDELVANRYLLREDAERLVAGRDAVKGLFSSP
jgi:hypothetical protein